MQNLCGFRLGTRRQLRGLVDPDCPNVDGDDRIVARYDLQAETDIDAAQLQKPAAERTAGKVSGCLFGKEIASTNNDRPRERFDNCELIDAVACFDMDFGEVVNRFDLQPVIPGVVPLGV